MMTPAKRKARSLPLLLAIACAAAVMAASSAQAQIISPSGTNSPAGVGSGDPGISGAIQQKPLLTPPQRSAIYAEVSKDRSKSSPQHFSPVIGADVPPMIELYALPDDAAAAVPEVKFYKYTMVDNKVVVVDPTKMRIVDVIGPSP